MKKYNLFKVLGITVFVAWILTLIIPASYVDYNGNITTDTISAVGIWALLSNLSISISYFNGIAIFLIAVACLYAVLSKMEVYNNFVKKTASLFQNKIGLLVTISIILFGVLGCVVSDAIILIVFIPFVYQVMKTLQVDKKVILSSTIIATLVGSMCGIYNSTLFGMLSIKVNTLLLVKLIVLVISLAVLIFFTAPRKTKEAKKEVTKLAKEEKKEKTKETSIKKSSKPATTKKQTTKKTPQKATTRKKVAK